MKRDDKIVQLSAGGYKRATQQQAYLIFLVFLCHDWQKGISVFYHQYFYAQF